MISLHQIREFLHDRVCFMCAGNPKQAITWAWFCSIFLVFVAFICGCAVANKTNHGALGFAAIWTNLLLIALSVGGTMCLRRYTTPLALGFFQGVVVVMANQCLIMFGIFAGESQNDEDEGEAAAGWFATMTFFLFINYLVFGGMLALFRSDLVKDDLGAVQGEGQKSEPQAAASDTN